MRKREKTREGVFIAGLRGRSSVICAMRKLGWSWSMIATHFKDDASLGEATGERFSGEWSRQLRRGMVIDSAAVSVLLGDFLATGHLPWDKWVVKTSAQSIRAVGDTETSYRGGPAIKSEAPLCRAGEPEVARSSILSNQEEIDGGVQNSPIEFPPSGVESMQKKLRTGIFKATDFADLLGFPTKVCELAFMEAKKEPRDLATVDRLVGRMVFSRLLRNEPGVQEYVRRLPGASKWEKLKATGIAAFETAAKMDQQ